MKKQKILIIKLSAIGDVVMTLPMIEAAKKKYGEDVEITWVCGKIASPIIKTFFEDVKVIEVDEKKLLKGSLLEKISEVIKIWLKIAFKKFVLVATAHSDIRYRLLTLPVIAKTKRHWGITNGRKHPVSGRYHGIEAVWLITGNDDNKLVEYKLPKLCIKNGLCEERCDEAIHKNMRQDVLKPSLEGGNKREGDLTSENFNSLEHLSSKAESKDAPFIKGGCQAMPDRGIFKETDEKPLCHYVTSQQRLSLPVAACTPPSMAAALKKGSKKRIVLVPGGAKNILADNPCRRWSLHKYVELTKELLKVGDEVILVGSDSDKWVNEAFNNLKVTNLIGKTNLIELLNVLSQADLVVTHDTGTLHLAQLTNTKTIALFGPTNPRELSEVSELTKIIWKPENLACCPCYDGKTYSECSDNKCMKNISVKEVLEVICGRW